MSMSDEMVQIEVKSTLDGSDQPSLLFVPKTDTPVPLVVGLHTWSFDRFNQVETYLPLCRQCGWALLLPEFRGPNLVSNPIRQKACGSPLARQDVIDAVRFVSANYPIDAKNVFLLGCSGGGHAALLVAEDAPELFRAVDVWCPVTNLRSWYNHQVQTKQHYPQHIEACLGGTPDEAPNECLSRSPSSRSNALKSLPVSIHHGRHDTVISFLDSRALASAIEAAGNDRVYLDIFDGVHEQIPIRSFEWFLQLMNGKRSAVQITG